MHKNSNFKTGKLPKDAYDLLLAKRVCFSALSTTLKFEEVDLEALRTAKKVFEKWHLKTFVMAVNSLENFIYGLSKYESLDKIPEDEEELLLEVLRILYILDGKLTEQITGKIKGEKYYPARPKDAEIEGKPKIIYKYIAETEKDWVRFCLVQLDFSLKRYPPPEEFGFFLEDKDKIKNKVFRAFEIAQENRADIVCFPELSFAKEWVEEIKNQYGETIIVGGSYYDEGYNVCPVIINGEYIDPPYKKHCPSPYERPETTGRGMKSGNILYIFQTKCGRFSVLTCSDYADQSYPICRYVCKNGGKVDFIINPSCDENILRFQSRCNSDCEDYNIDVVQVNKAPKDRKYGGTCIIGKEHKIILEKLIDDGFKPLDNITYKLFHLDSEMMIIANMHITIKAPSVSLPVNYAGRIKISKSGCYTYKHGLWLPLWK